MSWRDIGRSCNRARSGSIRSSPFGVAALNLSVESHARTGTPTSSVNFATNPDAYSSNRHTSINCPFPWRDCTKLPLASNTMLKRPTAITKPAVGSRLDCVR